MNRRTTERIQIQVLGYHRTTDHIHCSAGRVVWLYHQQKLVQHWYIPATPTLPKNILPLRHRHFLPAVTLFFPSGLLPRAVSFTRTHNVHLTRRGFWAFTLGINRHCPLHSSNSKDFCIASNSDSDQQCMSPSFSVGQCTRTRSKCELSRSHHRSSGIELPLWSGASKGCGWTVLVVYGWFRDNWCHGWFVCQGW